ncbi:MAG TPA: AsmA-like C-terminal region-containing protein [Vicinamibacteria bacterium]|nr:AsmA-like C-terminal region-containing protein [Vicinamibacteria bacterium]
MGGAALAATAAVAALLLVEFDAPAIGQAALARVGAATGARIAARGFRLQLVRGLALEGLDASSEIAGGRWTLSADALVLDHRFWPLLAGRVEVDRIVLRRPRLRLEQGPSTPPLPAAAAPVAAAAALALHVVEARVEDGAVELVAAGQPPVKVTGLDVSLADLALTGSTLAGLAAAGRARAESITFGTTAAREVEARFKVEKGGLAADDIRFRTAEGRFQTSFRARLDRLPLTYALDLRGEPIDLNALAGRPGDDGFGPATLTLAATGSGAGTRALRGDGVLRMQAGRLPAVPVLERLQAALGGAGLLGARYEASETPFRLRDGRAVFDSFRLRAAPLTVDMRGWIALDGPLELAVQVRAPRSMVRVAGVSADVLDTLADAEGQIMVPLTVSGTQSRPIVRPDAGALMAQAGRGLGRSALEKAAQGLKGFFRRR